MPLKVKIHLALLTVGLTYGANYSIAKYVMPEFMGPYAVIVMRVVLGAVFFWVVDYNMGSERIKHKRDYLALAGLAMLGVAINQLAFFKGLSMTTPITASVLMTSSPIIVLISAYFILHERISPQKLIGVALGATGAILLIGISGFSFNSETFNGNILIILNATSFSFYMVLVKPLLMRYKAMTIIKWIFFFASFVVVPFGYNELVVVEWAALPIEVYLALAYIIVATTWLVYLLNNWSLKFVSPSLVTSYIYVQPVFSTIVAVIFRGDKLRWQEAAYAMLIFMGVYLVSIRKGGKVSRD
jgi:drug/metabolite transporter (DMT)-like permease